MHKGVYFFIILYTHTHKQLYNRRTETQTKQKQISNTYPFRFAMKKKKETGKFYQITNADDDDRLNKFIEKYIFHYFIEMMMNMEWLIEEMFFI